MKSQEIQAIREHLVSPKAEVRKKALAELKKLSAGDAVDLLVSALANKNDDVQADLTRAFKSYKEAALPSLVKAFGHPSYQVRKSASTIIGALGDSLLFKFLSLVPKDQEDVDYWMVQTLSIMGGEATSYLIKAFHHQSLKIRLASIRSAVNVKDPKIVTALLPLLEENNWPVRKATYDALLEVHGQNPAAIGKALQHAPREAKYWVIQLAAEKRDTDLIPLFKRIVEQDAEELKLEAIKAMALIETHEVQKILVGYLSHKTWIVRKTAADAIFQQGLEVSDDLLAALHNPNTDARYWSVKLVGQSNEPKAFQKMMDCLHDENASVRAAACQALGSMGDKRATPHIMNLFSDPSEEVRTAAILAIGQIGERDVLVKPSIPRHLRPENQIGCPNCGKKVSRDFSFCPFCLNHLKSATCKKCSRTVEPDWKGCPNCGEPA
jgi:HEAT repeat protein/RNA polymerase subunit RPABC4/transcription elongation factor Spt4